ncbi:GAF domain-containing protein [candidate division WOR-3 bacterium]|nr:GAF domain-containing protein [candidate division WOR-3 bacterium]
MRIFERLYDVIQDMVSTLEIEELLKKMLDNAIEGAEAERGFIIIREGGRFSIRIARNIERKDIEAELSKTVLKEIMREGKSILTYDATVDPRFKNAPSIAIF